MFSSGHPVTITLGAWGMYVIMTGHQYTSQDYATFLVYAASGGTNYATLYNGGNVTFARDKLTITLTTSGTDTRYVVARL